jgi:hypothetical protein
MARGLAEGSVLALAWRDQGKPHSKKIRNRTKIQTGHHLLATCLLAGLLNYSSTLKMEAIRSSETSGATQRTTRRHIPEDDTLQVTTS